MTTALYLLRRAGAEVRGIFSQPLRRRTRLYAAGRLERRVGRIAKSVATADRKSNEPAGQEPCRRLPAASAPADAAAGPDRLATRPRRHPGNAATGSATGARSFPRRRGRRQRPHRKLMRFPPGTPNVNAQAPNAALCGRSLGAPGWAPVPKGREYTISLQMCCAASGSGSPLTWRSAGGAR